MPGEDNRYFYEPRGVAVVIAPWNFPLAILTGMATAALVTGNTVILKPAEQSAVDRREADGVLPGGGRAAGRGQLPPRRRRGDRPDARQRIPDVALIAFTGSLKVGLLINEQAAKTPGGQNLVKKVIAEMGGKNAVIVDADADLDEAVKGVVDSAFGYAGQKCSAGSRAIVLDGIYDQFLNRLVEATKSLTVGPGGRPRLLGRPGDRRRGPRPHPASRSRRARTKRGSRTRPTSASWRTQGFFVGPTIFADVPETSTHRAGRNLRPGARR